MKKYIPDNIKEEILSINWFSQLGVLTTEKNVILETDFNKINEYISSPEWENITLEESNNMNSYFYKRSLFSEQGEWNLIAEEGREFIRSKVIPNIPEIKEINRESLINNISWNLLHFIIENHYRRKKIIKTRFFSEIFEIYRAGRLPCGWSGNFPDGKLIVA